MDGHIDDPPTNRLLLALSPEDRNLLRPHMVLVPLKLRQSLEKAHTAIAFVYFLESGLGSVVANKKGSLAVELGLLGRDGMTGAALLQGDGQCAFECFVQMDGSALRISSQDLLLALARSMSLKQLLTRYVHALGVQIAYTALANSQNRLEDRLARWIVMVHDRMDDDRFLITHEFLAMMLGVRRPGVTVAIQTLEGKGLIRSWRGEIQICDRLGLEALTEGTYGPAEVEYERLTGVTLSKSIPPVGQTPHLFA